MTAGGGRVATTVGAANFFAALPCMVTCTVQILLSTVACKPRLVEGKVTETVGPHVRKCFLDRGIEIALQTLIGAAVPIKMACALCES